MKPGFDFDTPVEEYIFWGDVSSEFAAIFADLMRGLQATMVEPVSVYLSVEERRNNSPEFTFRINTTDSVFTRPVLAAVSERLGKLGWSDVSFVMDGTKS